MAKGRACLGSLGQAVKFGQTAAAHAAHAAAQKPAPYVAALHHRHDTVVRAEASGLQVAAEGLVLRG